MKVSTLFKVPSSAEDGSFFMWWVRFLSPFHDLTAKEMEVTAQLFQYRYELSKNVSDSLLLDKLVIDSDSRKAIEQRLGISHGYLNVILTKLRKCNIITGDRLNPKFVPNVKPDDSSKLFSVMVVFDFNANAKKERPRL